MDKSSNLSFPHIAASQAQKAVTHNEPIETLDAILQMSISDRDHTTPQIGPKAGDRYFVALGAVGDWAEKDNQIVAWQTSAWVFYELNEGRLVWIANEELLHTRSGVYFVGVTKLFL